MLLTYIGPATGFDLESNLVGWAVALGIVLPLVIAFAWLVWREHVRENG